jgi:phosphoribosylanthranilate isomerase
VSALPTPASIHVKICGVTTVADAEMCVAAGASSIGLNFVPGSPRKIDEARAIQIVRTLSSVKVLVVGVVADLTVDQMLALRSRLGLGCLQLHGSESPEQLDQLLPHAYKAVRVGAARDVTHARTFGGNYILVDAFVPGTLGGTGTTVDFSLVAPLAVERKLSLAGGLRPDNVASAIHAVRPFCVDVASGVESAPGVKDALKVRDFMAAARDAAPRAAH